MIGLLATIFIVLSFCFKKQKLIRVINLIGCSLFVIYGLQIGALYTWIANLILVFIQIYYIKKLSEDDSEN